MDQQIAKREESDELTVQLEDDDETDVVLLKQQTEMLII